MKFLFKCSTQFTMRREMSYLQVAMCIINIFGYNQSFQNLIKLLILRIVCEGYNCMFKCFWKMFFQIFQECSKISEEADLKIVDPTPFSSFEI